MLEVSIVLLILNIIVIKLQCRFEVNIVLVLTNKTFIKSHGRFERCSYVGLMCDARLVEIV
jgi:hypothetical protein